jgi:raffinose/stachyose/melibiose transport system substrate-binding protein
MNKFTKVAAVTMAAILALSVAPIAAQAATCTTPTKVTMLGTIKPEIQDQFLAAVADYNKSQTCYTVESIPGDRSISFLENVTPLYAAHNAPTIMYTLQEIPDMADKVMDWKGTKLAGLVPKDLAIAGNVGGKQVGVPSTVEGFGLLYNKKVLYKAHVDVTKINTRASLEAAFKAVQKSGTGAIRFSGIWWSLGAHVTNIYFSNAAATHEGRLKVLDQLADGKKNLMKDPAFQNWLATFNMMNKYNQLKKPNISNGDLEYANSVAALAKGKAGFWFMGNWAEPSLMKANPKSDFGIMPMPISNNPKDHGNNSISVGVPGYFMVDKTQSTAEQRAGAIDFLTWLYTSPAGQHHVIDPVTKGGMGFIPIYKGTTVKASTPMAKDIAKYVAANNTLEWMNTYYPSDGQAQYGAFGQQLLTGKINGAKYAALTQKSWKGEVKTWRGIKK